MLISQNFNGISISISVDNEEFEKNKENFTELNEICNDVMNRVSILMLHSNVVKVEVDIKLLIFH